MKIPRKLFLAVIPLLLAVALFFAAACYLGLTPFLFSPRLFWEAITTESADNSGTIHDLLKELPESSGTKSAPYPELQSGSGNSTGEAPSAAWKAGETDKNQLQRQIEAYYLSRLQRIAASYESRLNALIGEAAVEYKSAQQQGKLSVLSLARKYYASGSSLESRCDAEFYAVLDEFKTELRKNSLPLDTARQAQAAYERAKAARKKQMLSSAAKFL